MPNLWSEFKGGTQNFIIMGKCIYCGENAGLLRSKHKNCELKYTQGQTAYVNAIANAISENRNLDDLEAELARIREISFLGDDIVDKLTTEAFDLAVGKILEDGILSNDEEQMIIRFRDHFNLSLDTLDKNGSYEKVIMSAILRELTEGRIPEQSIRTSHQLPFLFQNSEVLIWVFNNVDFYEQITVTEFRGRSQGISIKVAKGLYYRTGVFKGKPVKTAKTKYYGRGLLALTSKHIYFASPEKKVKIPFNKLISLEPYEDGIGLQKDGVTAKPQIFKNLDGWFAHNAISNLSQ